MKGEPQAGEFKSAACAGSTINFNRGLRGSNVPIVFSYLASIWRSRSDWFGYLFLLWTTP